jgi:hypothetical protein
MYLVSQLLADSVCLHRPTPYILHFRYDRNGTAQAFGAQAHAMDPDEAKDNGWQLAEHFKLHLHPTTMNARIRITRIPLPNGVRIKKIYADFFRYLYQQTETFFKDHEFKGTTLWQNFLQKGAIEFVITHPNGWTLREQALLRKAAVRGGLVSESDAPHRVHMVTEGEATVHFVIFHEGVEGRLEVCLWYRRL